LDFSLSKIGIRDFLLPMHALGSKEFWKQKELLKVLEIKSPPHIFFEEQIAPCLADMIKNSINCTCMHFEAHMQNMSLQIRKGKAVKFIYHDLQDVMFDPVIYFCNHILKVNSKNTSQLEKAIEESYEVIDNFQLSRTINSQGERVNDSARGYETYTVVSFWRKYIRNLGDYTRIYNFFKGDDYFSGRRFEAAILRHLNFSNDDLDGNKNRENMKQHLFWCLDKYYKRLNNSKVSAAVERMAPIIEKKEILNLKEFTAKIQYYQYVTSGHFPTRPELVESNLIAEIRDLKDGKIFYFKYDSKDVLLIKCSTPTLHFEFGSKS
jgi:hypothetical protein